MAVALHTLVIGGGIGGLSLAREVTLRGFRVTVLEKAAKLSVVGAGIIMNPTPCASSNATGSRRACEREEAEVGNLPPNEGG